MKIYFFVLFSLALLASCNSKKAETNIKQEGFVGDTIQRIAESTPNTSVAIDTLSVDFDYFYKTVKELDSIPFLSFSKSSLKEFTLLKRGSTHFKYYILKEFKFQGLFKTLLIGEYYNSESFAYLVTYAETGKLIDHINVFYDNAEGAICTTSFVDVTNNEIKADDWNMYNNPETEIRRYKISSEGLFEKIR